MRPIYFLVGHPFGDPANEETIFEGPLSTREIADSALETHLLNGGQPARVVCLSEVDTAALRLIAEDLSCGQHKGDVRMSTIVLRAIGDVKE